MFHEEVSVRAPLIENENGPYTAENLNSGYLPHPVVTFCHLAFRGAALFFYIVCPLFSDSFIFSFVIIILLLSADFYTVKNISGRIMVGLRWWNFIDDNGDSHWIYESRKEGEQHLISGTESKIFWAGLFIFPFLWGLMFIVALFGIKFKWLILVIIALVLNGSNVYGYLKCRFGKSDKGIQETLSSYTSNFIREQVVQNVISSAMSGPHNQQQNSNIPHNVV